VGGELNKQVDKVFLQGLTAHCVVGVWEWEKAITQKIVVDLELATDIAKSAKTDQLEDTLDYKSIAERVIQMLEESRFQLIETMAEAVAELLQTEFSIAWVKVTINKGGAVKNVKNVGVQIERGEY